MQHWTQGGLTSICSLCFQGLARTVPEESECRRSWDVGPGQGVGSFEEITSGPSQKTPRRGMGSQASGRFEGDTSRTKAAGQVAIPVLVGTALSWQTHRRG